MTLRELILQRIGAEGPLSFTEYVDLALYHPALGYYARADRRSGRAGDFFTSVDLGPFFGELLAEQFAARYTQSKNAALIHCAAIGLAGVIYRLRAPRF